MEIREPGEVFIDTLLIGPSDASEIAENHDVPDEEYFKDDGSHFTTETVDDAEATDIYGNLETPPIDEDVAELANQIDEPTQNPRNPPPEIAIPADAGGTVTQQILHPNNAQEPTPPSTSPNGTIPKSRSLAQDKFEAKKVVFVTFDIETGGEYCGILQMSAEIVRVDVLPTISKKGTTSNLKN